MRLNAQVTVRIILAALLVVSGCSDSSEQPAPPEFSVRFRDRVIDLEPFLVGFPYSGFRADLEHGHLLYLEKTPQGTWLRKLGLNGAAAVDLAAGEKLTDVDWSTRSFGGGRLHAPSQRFLFTSDERNDEHTNVYAIHLGTGALERLTENDYTYGWGLSDDDRYLAYLDRKGDVEPFDTVLRIRDLETGEDREILSDGGGTDRFTWSYVRFAPDNKSVVLTVQHDGNRNTVSLARIALDAEEPVFDFLTAARVTRYGVGQVEGWVEDGVFLYLSSESGFRNLYRMDLATGAATSLTAFEDDIRSAEILATEPPSVLVVRRRPHESEVMVLDAGTGGTLFREVLPAMVSVMDAHGVTGLLSVNSLETPLRVERVEVRRDGDTVRLSWSPCFGVPEDLRKKLHHLEAERVEYPTFDGRKIHAYLLTPRNPPAAPDDRIVFIISFYGGRNGYSMLAQILAAAGISTLSPAPRGSGGFGAEFSALNDGDLGGDEIVDILHAGKWLVEERGYQPRQVGVRGGSHGGYATMRCLTFPPGTNGRGASFEFGFGWSHAGFSDILSFFETCNIPDWVLKEAGDPVTEREKLEDRSPYHHVDRLRAPLLLTHGSNDRRVPVEESRKFARRAAELGGPVTFVEFPDQGHGIRGFENQVRYYQTVLSFLDALELSPR